MLLSIKMPATLVVVGIFVGVYGCLLGSVEFLFRIFLKNTCVIF